MALSLRSLLATFTLIAFTVLSSVEGHNPRRPSKAGTVDLSKYSPTLSNGSASLPAPIGMTLKALTLGRGTQNYTCEPGSTAAPKAIGAVAELLDVTALIPLLPPKKVMKILNQLPSYLINYNFDQVSNSSIHACGHHYFTAAGVPTFDLGKKGLLSGKKVASITAPHGVGVDWLQLTAVAPSTLKAVYRVETVKGKAPKSCKHQPAAIQVQYAAQYWFYA